MLLVPINTVIISENPATALIIKKFESENEEIIKISGVAASTNDGIELVRSLKPDLIFMDILFDSDIFFDLLGKLEFNIPKLVFISARKSDAFHAFRYDAIDFIPKPVQFNFLILAVYKVIKRIEMERALQELNNEKIADINSNRIKGFVAVSSLDKIDLIQMADILFCQSYGKYTVFHLANGKKITSSRNLGEYIKILDDNFFFRVHHSYIVNLRQIIKISKRDGYFCEFSGGINVPVASRRQEDFQRFMKL
ncbi:MAG: LytTR family DNA-binding domain-containing protein [Flavobacterium sp.]|nr:LytTR family DNA-binding domain-containing protein [Flavobacterium sp.]